jgi:homoprotocatechuate degradation regulator HpaR
MTRQAIAPGAANAPRFAYRNLPMLLLRAREGALAHFRPILNAHGVTEQQWRIVRVLMEFGPLEPRQIVELCCISSPSLAGILARMDEMKLVARERVGHDQRRVRVSLTAASRRLAAHMAPQIEAVYRDIEAHIGADFTARFYRTLDELIAMMDEPALTMRRPG